MSAISERNKLTPPKLARRWGVSTNKILFFIGTGELRALNLARRPNGRPRYVIDIEDVQKFERARTVRPDGESAKSVGQQGQMGINH
jgi:hypothetical protein